MNLEYVPLLQVQRDLYALPPGRERFQTYLRTILKDDGNSVELPSLIVMNPAGKEHVAALLDGLLALDADGIARQAVADAAEELVKTPGKAKVALVIADDLKGGWTNRYAAEFTQRFECGTPGRLPRWLKEFWITAVLWSSEPASARAVRESILAAVYRMAYIRQHGPASTLRARLTQEGEVLARAGCVEPALDAEDLFYTREVLIPYFDATNMRTTIECLFGDTAAHTLGFTPRGLSPSAGLALALHEARTRSCVRSVRDDATIS